MKYRSGEKSMNINKMKSFVIIILVIAAVYQTGLLWLEDKP